MSPQEFNDCFREEFYTELCVNAKLEFKLPSVLMSRHYKCKERKGKKEEEGILKAYNNVVSLTTKLCNYLLFFGFFQKECWRLRDNV